MATQSAYKGQITLEFRYKETKNSSVQVEAIESERIKYVMIEHKYENVHILPVVYVSVSLSSDMYSKVVGTTETSKFHLVIKKKDALSNTSIYKKVVDDIFTYVASSNSANYADALNENTVDSYRNILIGLVSDQMTNTLRKNFNGIYNNIDTDGLIDLALEGMKNVIKAPLKHNSTFDSILIPPVTSRYKMLEYIKSIAPYYDSNYTFYMDFNKTYLIPKNGVAIEDGSKPNTANITIKNFTASEAYTDGYSIVNGAYVMSVNATNTHMVVNNSTSKVSNNIIGYSDYFSEAQDLNITNDNADITTKTTYVRSNNAAEIRNDLENSAMMIQLMKQNVDGDIFNPNMCFNVTNYGDYSKYDGRYYLSFKRDFYYITQNSEFTITTDIGLKLTGEETVAQATKNTYNSKSRISTRRSVYSSSSSKYNGNNCKSRRS